MEDMYRGHRGFGKDGRLVDNFSINVKLGPLRKQAPSTFTTGTLFLYNHRAISAEEAWKIAAAPVEQDPEVAKDSHPGSDKQVLDP